MLVLGRNRSRSTLSWSNRNSVHRCHVQVFLQTCWPLRPLQHQQDPPSGGLTDFAWFRHGSSEAAGVCSRTRGSWKQAVLQACRRSSYPHCPDRGLKRCWIRRRVVSWLCWTTGSSCAAHAHCFHGYCCCCRRVVNSRFHREGWKMILRRQKTRACHQGEHSSPCSRRIAIV
jgi:hypothetical protein